jgi:hypothetical protein
MEKEFIPYELALRMKELGFNEPCFGYYDEGGNLYTEMVEVLKAPLYQQVFRWFREKYNLHAEITWSPSYEYDPGEWSDAIYEITIVDVSYTKEWKAESIDMQRANGKQLTYEGAELACLEKLIELVK